MRGQPVEQKLGALARAPSGLQLGTSEREAARLLNQEPHSAEPSLKDIRELIVHEKIGLIATDLWARLRHGKK